MAGQSQDLLINTGSGNRILISGYRSAQEFMIERRLCTHQLG